MQTIAEEVQNKLAKHLVEVNVFEEVKNSFDDETKSAYQFIKKIGGRKVSNVLQMTKEEDENKNPEALNLLKQKIKELQLDPRWKIITYGSLMNILTEHNLVLGGLNKYEKEIPEKNAKKMLEYSKCERTHIHPVDYSPLFNFKQNIYYTPSDLKFYVCASADNFQSHMRNQIGQELVYSNVFEKQKFEWSLPNPDPIIVSPLIYEFNGNRFLLIDVVTSWDREAGLIVNEMEN